MSITTAFEAHTTGPYLNGLTSMATPATGSPALLRKIEALRSVRMFAGSSDAELTRLAEASLLRRFERGRSVLRPGGIDDCVILVEGRAKTTIPRGIACGEFALAILEAGDIVSEACWAQQRSPEPGETVALETSAALFVPRRALEQLLERNARVAVQFLAAVATKLRRVIDLATQNACLPVADRLYCRLVELAASRGRSVQQGILIHHGLFQNELAAGIGASREAVNRQLGIWREQGLVESGRGFLLVKDPLGLTQSVSTSARTAWLAESMEEKAS